MAPWNFRSLELSLSGVKVLGLFARSLNFHSLERSLVGTFAPMSNGNFRSLQLTLLEDDVLDC